LAQSFSSPFDRLKTQLGSSLSAGTIPSADATALSTALDTIDSALQSKRPGETGGTRHRADPSEMQARIASLIGDQVKAGTLTSDQADELKQVFSDAFQGGPGGEPPAGPSQDDSASLIADFVKQIQDSLGKGPAYGSSGQASGVGALSVLIDYQA
jgi:hypothetical protein